MRNKIKNATPLFLSGLLLLAACNKESAQGNYLSLQIEQPGSNSSKVVLSGPNTYWEEGDYIMVKYSTTTYLPRIIYKVLYNTDTREPYLANTGSGSGTDQASIPVPEEGYCYLACTPELLPTNIIPTLDEGQAYKTLTPDFPKKQRWVMSIDYYDNNYAIKYSSPDIPLVAMTPRNENYLYMRPLAAVFDVRLTNSFANMGLTVDSIAITSNHNINGQRTVRFWPGREAQKPQFVPTTGSWEDKYKRVSLIPSGSINSMSNYFTPGTTLNFPIFIAPTDCIEPENGTAATGTDLDFYIYFRSDAGHKFTYHRQAQTNRRIPGGLYFTAPIDLDEDNVSGSIDLVPYNGTWTGGSFWDDGNL